MSAKYFSEPGIIIIAAGTLDDANQIKLLLHAYAGRRVDWIKLNDDLRKYPEGEPVSGIEV